MAIIETDSDTSIGQEVHRGAVPVNEQRSNSIPKPTLRNTQKLATPSAPPPVAPSGNPRATTRRPNPTRVLPAKTEPRTPPPRPSSYIEQTSNPVVQRILRGEPHNATFEGTSQYAAGGSSACGLASMNAIRLAFELCSRMTDAEQLVSALISEEFVRAAMGIVTYWPNEMHLEVEPILQLPLFSNSIRTLDNQYAACTYRTFSNAVMALRFDGQSPGPRAVCLTRPPEVMAVMHIPIPTSTPNNWSPWGLQRRTESIYLVFDSHPRPNHPNGAGVQILPSRLVNDVADYLMDLFQVDQDIMNEPGLEWTVQLLGQLSYHLLAPSPAREPVDEYALNMRILEENWKRTQAEDKQKAAEAETRKLKSQGFDQRQEIAMLKAKDQRARDEIQGLKEQLDRRPPPPKEEQRNSGWFSSGNRASESSRAKGKGREVPGGWPAGQAPSEESRFSTWFRGGRGGGESSKSTEDGWVNPVGPRASAGGNLSTRASDTSDFGYSSFGRAPPRHSPNYASVSSRAGGSSNNHDSDVGTNDVETDRSLQLAIELQREFDKERIEISTTKDVPSNPEPTPLRKAPTRYVRPIRPIRPGRTFRPIRPVRPPVNPAPSSSRAGGPSASAHKEDLDAIRSLELAMRLQREFDDETAEVAKNELLAKAMEQPSFDCGICMDTFPNEAIALIEECGHSCCRDCMRANIQAMIEDRRYPLPCPFCVAGPDDDDDEQYAIATIPPWIVETIGISPELFEIYTELQLAVHSVMIDCRGCSNSVFVDREDYDQAEYITCPMGCTYKWCKECNQTIKSGEKHTCDGSAEFENLMNQEGWKHCPGCRAPIERYIGCNHIICTTPGCNVHFCYVCGGTITEGGTRNEIQAAVENHYQGCVLFEVPPEI